MMNETRKGNTNEKQNDDKNKKLITKKTIEQENDNNDEFQVEKGRFFQLHIDQLPKNNEFTLNPTKPGMATLYKVIPTDDRPGPTFRK